MGLLEILFVLFLVLKLIGVIDWSWWWVFSPLAPAAIIWIAILGVYVAALSSFRLWR